MTRDGSPGTRERSGRAGRSRASRTGGRRGPHPRDQQRAHLLPIAFGGDEVVGGVAVDVLFDAGPGRRRHRAAFGQRHPERFEPHRRHRRDAAGIDEAHAVGANLEIAADRRGSPSPATAAGPRRAPTPAGARPAARGRSTPTSALRPAAAGLPRAGPSPRRPPPAADASGGWRCGRWSRAGSSGRGTGSLPRRWRDRRSRALPPATTSGRSARSRRSASMSRSAPGRVLDVRLELVDRGVEPGVPRLHQVERAP